MKSSNNKFYLILLIKLTLIIQFVSLNKSNDTHFIATNEWQEIKSGKNRIKKLSKNQN